jgi:hypothetical protein
VGAAVASALSDWARLPDWQRRLLVACGAGAGMAAVYNVPLGGALFALEVLLGTLTLPLVLPALATSLIATAIAWIALPTAPTYTIPTYAVQRLADRVGGDRRADRRAGGESAGYAWSRARTRCARPGGGAGGADRRVHGAGRDWRSPTRSCWATANRSCSWRSWRS